MATQTEGRQVLNHFEYQDTKDVRKISPETLSVSCAVLAPLQPQALTVTDGSSLCVCVWEGRQAERSQTS